MILMGMLGLTIRHSCRAVMGLGQEKNQIFVPCSDDSGLKTATTLFVLLRLGGDSYWPMVVNENSLLD